ncbi:MAG: class I SAM-dependent methyltransferase [Kofleriaceae bacterium]
MADQVDTGIRAGFSIPWVYSQAQSLIGADRARRTLIERYLGSLANADVIDLGCGPGDIVPHLGARSYVGYDPSDAYITAARRKHPSAEFHVAGVEHVAARETRTFQLAIAIGVVHHLDDATATALFRTARAVLAPGGRCVTIDPVFVAGQRWIARTLARLDRGQHVRDVASYTALARSAFDRVEVDQRGDLLRVPYDHLIITCTV